MFIPFKRIAGNAEVRDTSGENAYTKHQTNDNKVTGIQTHADIIYYSFTVILREFLFQYHIDLITRDFKASRT